MNSTEFLKCKKPGGDTLEAVNLAMVHLCNDDDHRPIMATNTNRITL
jgi:hypothetical protein